MGGGGGEKKDGFKITVFFSFLLEWGFLLAEFRPLKGIFFAGVVRSAFFFCGIFFFLFVCHFSS